MPAAAWAGIIAALFTVLAFFQPFMNQNGEGPVTGSSQSQLPPGGSSIPAAEVANPVVAGDLHAGTCLSNFATDSTPVSCQLPHVAEVFSSTGNCSEKTLIAYLGGNPAVDILRDDLTIQVQSDESCIVKFPASPTFDESAQGVLGRPHSAALRQCVNEVSGTDVNCQEKHTGEVVAVIPKNETRSVNCIDMAATYMDRNPSDLYHQLKVKQEDSDNGFRCVVAVNGSNQLVDTLRMLGTSTVPISPY